VAGTCLVILAGPGAWLNRSVLSRRPLVWLGLISYPLYLWHWPLLSFPVSLGMPLTNELRVIILIASVVLAALTHELVERPSRIEQSTARTSGVLLAAWLLTLLFGCGALLTDGFESTYPDSMRIELR
jgi:peptidoglycan/LPS O-acetylase OafA/YrhL